MRWILFLLSFVSILSADIKKTEFVFSKEPIDVVIPCHPKDTGTLELCIEGIRKHGKNIRRIIVVSKERLTGSAEWFDEALYPFNKETIALEIFHGNLTLAQEFLTHPQCRAGWILQQLLKLYAPFVIPDISENVLVLDADVVFLKPIKFMNKEGGPLFATGEEMHYPYFTHAAHLLPGLKRVFKQHSGIAHHMLFQAPVLGDLFQKISKIHQTEPWKAICRCIDPKEAQSSPFSEYEIYFNYIFLRTDQAEIRPVEWKLLSSPEQIFHYRHKGKHTYVVCPTWSR